MTPPAAECSRGEPENRQLWLTGDRMANRRGRVE